MSCLHTVHTCKESALHMSGDVETCDTRDDLSSGTTAGFSHKETSTMVDGERSISRRSANSYSHAILHRDPSPTDDLVFISEEKARWEMWAIGKKRGLFR